MGEFIGNTGAFLLLFAAVLIFTVFLKDTGIIKDKNIFKSDIKILTYTTVIGMVYYFVIAYMKNTMAGQTNMFDYKTIFGFLGMDNVMNTFENPTIKGGFYGTLMPLYPYLINLIGGLVFDKYEGTAVFLNFMGTAVGMCALFNAFKKTSVDKLFYILILPFAFLLFTPMGVGMAFGITALCTAAFYNGKRHLWLILGIIAVLINKFGILFLAPLFVTEDNVSKALGNIQNSFKNPYVKNSILYVEIIICTIVIFLAVGGVN